MKANISNVIFGENFNITINNCECTVENILKVITLFDFKLALITISSLRKKSELIKLLSIQKVSYILTEPIDNMVEVTTLVRKELMYTLLDFIVKEDPEIICVTNITKDVEDIILNYLSPQVLIMKGYSDMTINIATDRKCFFMTLSKKYYNYKQICKEIKKR